MNAWARLRSRDRRAITVGALVLVPALGFSLVARPYARARADLERRLDEQRALLGRELALVDAAGRLPTAMDAAARELARRRARLLPGRDGLSATAALVDVVGDEARRHSVLLEAIESRQPEATGSGLLAVAIEVRGRGDLEGLLGWLRALESGARLLRVDGLTVGRTDAGAEAHAHDTETLLLAATIRGYVLP